MSIDYKCYEIMHAGEGPRGTSVVILAAPGRDPAEIAKEAGEYFDDVELRRTGWDPADLEDAERYIEVTAGSASFGIHRVSFELVRKYQARPYTPPAPSPEPRAPA